MPQELTLTNARIVLDDEVIAGSVVIRDGLIAAIDTGHSRRGEDMEGDHLIPGLVELHTDHLESHYSPRPGVVWDSIAALQAHDAQVAGSGITTVFDCLRLGSDEDGGYKRGEMRAIADAIETANAEDRLRASHLIHLRCEVSAADVLDHFEDFRDDPQVRLASLMDHAPGQRQFQTLEAYTLYYKKKRGLNDAEFQRFVERRIAESERYAGPHRKAIAEACSERGIAIASHDDATLDHVEESKGFGVRLAEFPTSMEAAKASHEAGMAVLMGAPNVVRGKSHSGNVSAKALADARVLDVLSSDYVPFSLIHAPFMLADAAGMTLPESIRLVTATPARAVGLEDRGRIGIGLRADLVRVRRSSGVPVVRSVWREGRRVA
ncbi:alpha-D-ribose 1-methylphosphonate 5-triphosphate diphosphatase [Pseudaminobacter sp. 19-2017]|uniref:Alpha-D-ribose 1-methylphosphonate 5-triphosphate diphosphatase n=1 Tax=Pseudaminobacter soli (ex Zhang et al. 2022) TaxID=2831468 RepID=A0A942E8V7_9HYPH|nr:alpha-D-ribose 1-methylphosphonate 5-triphosphate diphosphatase [Pseudaminobacter soli]MBS3650562.1 alpha-D-ribose 1-methylphosphonate 5-triphosphate diphosphatase [Pseudaminobacter soli]